jgi:pilus assembly protein CpaB
MKMKTARLAVLGVALVAGLAVLGVALVAGISAAVLASRSNPPEKAAAPPPPLTDGVLVAA